MFDPGQVQGACDVSEFTVQVWLQMTIQTLNIAFYVGGKE